MTAVHWERKPLGAVADLCLGKMLDQKKNRGEPLPYLANVNVRWGDFNLDALRTMRFEPKEMERYGLKFGDIVMCEGGEPGRCAIWKDQVPGMMIQKALHRIRPKDCLDYRYLFYSFLNTGQMHGLDQYFTGSTIKHLPGEQLAKVQIDIPPLPTQRRIASILSAYDDLIENNTRRIAILEEMARRIYEEWFVHFRFPEHEKVRMVESELGAIPDEWEMSTLSQLTEYINRGLAPKYDDEAEGRVINQKCIRDGRLNMEPARRQSKPIPAEKLVRFGDVLINSTGVGTLGRVAQVYEALDNCTVDTHVSIVRPMQGLNQDFFGLALLRLSPHFESQGVGATGQTELSRGRIAETIVAIPPQKLQEDFGAMVRPIRQLAVALGKKNMNLRTQRDLLLPKLISGEIEVSNLPEPEALAA
ncbi:MAG: restriction endonuclease subunit S [Alphaproteobacteria bacterium]|nr:restriction endonuclease subunit S [Alphaproteobacteria bacterium]